MKNPVVEALRALQVLDREIWDLRRRRAERPRVLEVKRADVANRKGAHAARLEAKKSLDKEADRMDLELKSAEGQIQKLQLALNQAKTNKEYTVLKNEIGSKKAEVSQFEDKVLAAMQKSEAAAAEVRGLEAEAKRAGGELQALDKEVAGEVGKIEAQLRDLEAKRAEKSKGLEPEALARYDRILEGRGGQALAAVVDGACQGCGKNLTPQEENALLAGHGLVICRACTRILYTPEGA
ncbi:MAG: hypothetical protein L0216_04180 [Planctomycetales bacterium]|nr:hypothetical protein [Planctomycetales bacterium]